MASLAFSRTSFEDIPHVNVPPLGSPSLMAFNLASSAAGGVAPFPATLITPPLADLAKAARGAGNPTPTPIAKVNKMTAGLHMGASNGVRGSGAKKRLKLAQNEF